jgi:hypothetical protein
MEINHEKINHERRIKNILDSINLNGNKTDSFNVNLKNELTLKGK